jgi:hypothetical protein
MRERLRLQPQEEAAFSQWFSQLSNGEHCVPGRVAAVFLKKSNLPQQQLKEIWDVCDTGRRGAIDQVPVSGTALCCLWHVHAFDSIFPTTFAHRWRASGLVSRRKGLSAVEPCRQTIG